MRNPKARPPRGKGKSSKMVRDMAAALQALVEFAEVFGDGLEKEKEFLKAAKLVKKYRSKEEPA